MSGKPFLDDIESVVSVATWLNRHDPDGPVFIEDASITLGNKNGYVIGTLAWVDDQWRVDFTRYGDEIPDVADTTEPPDTGSNPSAEAS